MTVKFCDWFKEREDAKSGAPGNHDAQAWMICSIDLEGRVVITTIAVFALGILKSSKFTILDPTKLDPSLTAGKNMDIEKYQVIIPRFHDKIFP